eukprot:1185802-Prorocentrum_minimum.AAC.1
MASQGSDGVFRGRLTYNLPASSSKNEVRLRENTERPLSLCGCVHLSFAGRWWGNKLRARRASLGEVELVELSEVELRVAVASIQISKGSDLAEVKFTDIVRTFVEVVGLTSGGDPYSPLYAVCCTSPTVPGLSPGLGTRGGRNASVILYGGVSYCTRHSIVNVVQGVPPFGCKDNFDNARVQPLGFRIAVHPGEGSPLGGRVWYP